MESMAEQNLGSTWLSMGPKNKETRNRTISIKQKSPQWGRGAGWLIFVTIKNDLTNMQATAKIATVETGQTTSKKKTSLRVARGTSPERFSDGCHSLFSYPAIISDKRQYPIQELRCERELPCDVHLKKSLKNGRAIVRRLVENLASNR